MAATEVHTWLQLQNVGGGAAPWSLSDDYILVNDLLTTDGDYAAMNGTGASSFDPIGSGGSEFTGSFDGQNYNIFGLVVDRAASDDCGLFGATIDADFSNVTLVDASVEGDDNVGALIGDFNQSAGSPTVTNCHSSGSVLGHGNHVGGLIGRATTGTALSNCSSSATVTVTGADPATESDTGGLAGELSGTASNCYATGNVTSNAQKAGGFAGFGAGDCTDCFATGDVQAEHVVAGFHANPAGTLTRCFATGNVTAVPTVNIGTAGGFMGVGAPTLLTDCYALGNVTGVENVGGFTGVVNGDFTNCYCCNSVSGTTNVGGFIGKRNGGTYTDCFFNSDLFGSSDAVGNEAPDPGGIYAKTTNEMRALATFIDTSGDVVTAWDFYGTMADDAATNDYWSINAALNEGYPYLIKWRAFVEQRRNLMRLRSVGGRL